MDRKTYKSKPQHLVTNAKTGEIKRIVHSADTDVGSSQIGADLRVFGSSTVTGSFGVTQDSLLSGRTIATQLESPVIALTFGHRLSLSSSVSMPISNIPSGSTLFLTRHTSDYLGLFNGTSWKMASASFVSMSLTGLTANRNYDVFVYEANGLLALEMVAWNTNVLRSTELTTQNGVFVKSGDATKRYAGTVRTQATNSIPDSTSKRFVWNLYNQKPRFLHVIETTDSWAYTVQAFRQTRGSDQNKFEYVTGMPDTELEATAHSIYFSTTTTITCMGGVGLDSTTANSAQTWGGANGAANIAQFDTAKYNGYPGVGYHAVNWLEYGSTDVTFLGDFGGAQYQSGMHGKVTG